MSYLLKYNAFILVYCQKILILFTFVISSYRKVELLFPKSVVNFFGSNLEIKECALWITSFQYIVLH
jgi:hypothetical protein